MTIVARLFLQILQQKRYWVYRLIKCKVENQQILDGKCIHVDGSNFPGEKHPAMVALKTGKKVKNVIMGVFNPKDEQTHWININATPIYKKEENTPYLIYTIFEDITEQLKDKEAFNKSQKLLQDIINGFPSIIFVKDIKGRFLIVNNKLEELLGVKNEELNGKTDYDLFTKEIAEYYRFNDQKVIEERKAIHFEEEADLTDGHHTFIANKFPIFDKNGKPYGVGSISTDITERKLLEEQLKEAHDTLEQKVKERTEELLKSNKDLQEHSEMLSTIYELNPDAIVLTSVSDSKIIDCNQEYLNQIGYSREEVIGHTSQELNLINEVTHETYIDETRGNKKVSNIEIRKRKDGSLIDVLYSTRQIKVNNKQVILNIGRDVTKSRRIEKTLQESEERFRTLADNIPNLAWMADASGWIFWYNKQWYEYTGTTLEEMQGMGLGKKYIIPIMLTL